MVALAEELSGLPQDRTEVRDLLEKWDTKPYEDKEEIFDPYLNRLFRISYVCEDRSDVDVDLEILKDLLHLLEPDVYEGQMNYIHFQLAVIQAHKKLGKLLQEFDRKIKDGIIIPDNDFKEWMDREIKKEDWKEHLTFVAEFQPEVVRRANVKGVPFEEQTIDIDAESLEDIDNLLKRYRKELEDAHNMTQKNVDCIGHGPKVCELIKEIVSRLSSNRGSAIPDDDIKEETSHGVQSTSQGIGSAKVTGPE